MISDERIHRLKAEWKREVGMLAQLREENEALLDRIESLESDLAEVRDQRDELGNTLSAIEAVLRDSYR